MYTHMDRRRESDRVRDGAGDRDRFIDRHIHIYIYIWIEEK